ncbi:MAG: molybdenum cofactor guanylyltransferase [Planctomycetota bacterium]
MSSDVTLVTGVTLAGCVLAGGRSTRMGQCKATLQLPNGETFLQHAINRFRQCEQLSRIAVSVSADTERRVDDGTASLNNITMLPDDCVDLGPISGIISGLQFAVAAQAHGCLFAPVDVPDLTADDCAGLIATFQRDPHRFVIATSTDQEQLEPLIAIYPVAALPALEMRATTQQRSLVGYLAQQSSEAIHTVRIDNSNLQNFNDASQLVRWRDKQTETERA